MVNRSCHHPSLFLIIPFFLFVPLKLNTHHHPAILLRQVLNRILKESKKKKIGGQSHNTDCDFFDSEATFLLHSLNKRNCIGLKCQKLQKHKHMHIIIHHMYMYSHTRVHYFSADYQESMARNQELSERGKTVALLLDVSPSYPLCQPFMAL